MRNFLIASLFAWLMVTAACLAQQSDRITVHVIDITNGKPAARRDVWIERINPDTHMPIVENGMPLKGKTDVDGMVSFPAVFLHPNLPSDQNKPGGRIDIPPRSRLTTVLDVQVTYAGGGVQCSTGLFSLSYILKSGVVGDNRCKKSIDLSNFKPAPGEVTIFVGKYHWWDAGKT